MTDALVLPATDGGRRITVVAHHADDPVATSARDVWAGLSGASQLSPFMCVAHQAPASSTSSNSGPAPMDMDRPTRLLADGDWESVRLLDVLHRLGELSRVDIVTACTTGLDAGQRAELGEADAMLRHDLRRIMPDATQVLSHRVWIPHYGDAELAPIEAFASPDASSVTVVLPVDRQFERAAAMPVGSAGPGDETDDRPSDVYAWHAAVEVASLAGLWSTMDCAPVESLEHAADGLGRPLVRLVRTMCRAARIHTPSLAPSAEQPLDDTGLLPLTPGMLPAPDSVSFVRAVAPHIYPPTFRELNDAPQSELRRLMSMAEEASARRLAAEAVGAVLESSHDVTEWAARLDDYIAGTVEVAPWTEPLSADSQQGDEGSSDPVSESRELLDRIGAPVSIESVPVQGWDEALDAFFGMADAKTTSDGIRAAAARSRFVIVEPHVLAPDAGGLAEAIALLDGHEPRPTEGISEIAADDPVDRVANDPLSVAAAPAEFDLGEPDEDAEEGSEDDSPQPDDSSALGDLTPPVGSSQLDEAPLLVQVTSQFDAEIAHSEGDVAHHIGQLHDKMRRENRPEPGVTSFVSYALLASVLIGVGSLLTLTGWREIFTPDRLGDAVRVATFLLIALLATLPPVLRLTPSRSLSVQVRLTIIAAAYAGAAVAVVVTAPIIEESFLDRPGRWWPAVIVVLVVMALAIFARRREFSGDRALMGPSMALVGNRVAGVLPFAYAFIMAVAFLNFSPTAPAIFENRSWRLLAVLLAVSIAGALASGTLIRLVRRRDRRLVREWRRSIDDLVDRCEQDSARTAALKVLKAHWLTTAAVAARLVYRPFGTHHAADEPHDPESAVLKLLMFDLHLTEEARHLYLGELLPVLAPKGWLREQYRRMSSQFASSERTRQGIDADGQLSLPEHCTYPMSLESVTDAQGSGDRWRFAQSVYAGDFDALLHESAATAMNQAMAATFMSERAGVSLGPDDPRTLPQLLGELLPSGEERLPAGTLPQSVQRAPEYQSRIWWPALVPMPSDQPPVEHQCEPLHTQGTVLFHAVRVDISEPVDLDRLRPIGGAETVSSPDGSDAGASDSDDPPDQPLI